MKKYLAIRVRSKRLQGLLVDFAQGDLRFIAAPYVSFRNYPESESRAQRALDTAIRRPKSKFLKFLRRSFLRFQYNWSRKFFERHPEVTALCWNGLNSSRRVFMDGAKDAGAKTYFFENSPFPGRITIDSHGVNYENSLPRNIKFYVDWQNRHQDKADLWLSFKDRLRSRSEIVNKNVSQVREEQYSLGMKPYIFVPLQVQTDSQLRLYGGWAGSVDYFLEVLGEASQALAPSWTVRLKEHPSSKIPYRLNRFIERYPRFRVDNSTDTLQQVKAAKVVLTVNSSVGLEAMFFDKPVLVCGRAFYCFNGLATEVQTESRLAEIFSQIEQIDFDTYHRNCFLNYLLEEYYPSVTSVIKTPST